MSSLPQWKHLEDGSATVPLRIRFTSFMRAYETFHSFPPDDMHYLSGWSRKRDADSQVILLSLFDPARLEDFLTLCKANPDVCEVSFITEEEFWLAPSNAV
jgi:hypothetical protein